MFEGRLKILKGGKKDACKRIQREIPVRWSMKDGQKQRGEDTKIHKKPKQKNVEYLVERTKKKAVKRERAQDWWGKNLQETTESTNHILEA